MAASATFFFCRQYAAKFAGFGVQVSPADIVTSGSAMADYLREAGVKEAYVVGNQSGDDNGFCLSQ